MRKNFFPFPGSGANMWLRADRDLGLFKILILGIIFFVNSSVVDPEPVDP